MEADDNAPVIDVAINAELYKKLDRHRGHVWRYWRADAQDPQPWTEVKMGKPQTFSKVSLVEKYSWICDYFRSA
ncbi:hypothetical protein BVY04_03405 [bacterium M21]|nr:hypothetical protein BVY04_03405 [bacterium M21]